MFLLHKFEERRHVRSTEVVDCLQSREHTGLGESLEMILTDVQHGRSQIELVEKLSDEDVNLEDVGDILLLNVTKDVDEPLEVFVGRTDPEEVNLV